MLTTIEATTVMAATGATDRSRRRNAVTLTNRADDQIRPRDIATPVPTRIETGST
jgi:hypothetical protein